MLHQGTETMPVQVQNLSAYLAGEIDGFDALMQSLGALVLTACLAVLSRLNNPDRSACHHLVKGSRGFVNRTTICM